MGYLLKEVLKTLCGVNQWSYAVFWKIGCQNTKLLIWEESYCETSTFSGIHGTSGLENPGLAFQDWSASLHLLINKMMRDNQFNLVGEGLIGRAAVTGNHQWILSKDLSNDAHPPEVLKEICQQVSAGIQTISVIPVLPHGVVQFGSYLHIMENMGFVDDVRTLISQLGCVPGVLLSDENATKEPSVYSARPVYLGSSASVESCGRAAVLNSAPILGSCSYNDNTIQTEGFIGQTSSSLAGEVQNSMQSTDAAFQPSNITQCFAEYSDNQFHRKISPEVKPYMSANSQMTDNMIKVEVLPPNPDVWMNQQASLNIPKQPYFEESSIGSVTLGSGSIRLIEQQISGENSLSRDNLTLPNGFRGSQPRSGHVPTSNFHGNYILRSTGVTEESTGNGLQCGSSELKASSSYDVVNHMINNHSLDPQGAQLLFDGSKKMVENDLFQALGIMLTGNEQPSSSECIQDIYGERHEHGVRNSLFDNAKYDDVYVQCQSGNDLFDVLGSDFKNRLLNDSWNNEQSNGPDPNTKDCIKNSSMSTLSLDASSTVNQGNSDSGMFSMTGFDRILDAMVSNRSAKVSLDDNVSSRTTLTNLSSSSAPNASCSYGRVGISNQILGEPSGPPKTLSKSGAMSSCSFNSECSKESSGMYSQSSSIYGSQISSWMEGGHDTKPSSSVSTGYSKKTDEMNKTGRKRLKPGENPRPRPKDRQMIQDRVKELREIVPNGAKCSIDALLERTIKHMIFLQSVTKHADKLKQTGESKIVSKEGGLLLKDSNLEGGATWAYEVGSQSMVCPIIVEDLNQPRQMLVEMLCEERGLFLEIADIIRGLGLTILKGVMETRNDKIWARFSVEANRDVTRMEIFISLVRLLEQTAKGGAEPANAVDNNTATVHSFHQTASVSATGRPSSLL